MKRIIVLLLVFNAANLNIFSQVDPCYVLTEVLREVDKAVVQGKYDDALRMLEQVKKDTKNKQCPEMKDGVVDYKIKDVKEKINKRDGGKCPDNHHPHAIDLGLPSGTKWACCNVGADKPEGYGGYYSWGETETKSTYDWSTYKHCEGTKESCRNIGSDIAGTLYDVAHVKWSGSWVMPSRDQVKELLDNCSHEWTTFNGVIGRKFTSKKNGGSVFLPAAGGRLLDDLYNAGSRGHYWSSTQYSLDSYSAFYFYFDLGSTYWDTDVYLFSGRTVRPVSR